MYPNDAAAQAEGVFVMVGAILEAAGMSFADVVKASDFSHEYCRLQQSVTRSEVAILRIHAPSALL